MAGIEYEYRCQQNKLKQFQKKLEEKCLPVKNDQRQQNYCRYITEFVSHFSDERVIVVGSTIERTRLRANKDEGDFDYLIISHIKIPIEVLEYRQDVPCFVHINAEMIKDLFPETQLVDGKFLPSRLLKTVSKEAFKFMNGIKDVVLTPSVTRGRHNTKVDFVKDCKPGTKLQVYAGFRSDTNLVPNTKPTPNLEETRRQFHSALKSSDISQNTTSLITNIFSVIESFKTDESANALIYQTFGGLIQAVSDETSSNPQKRQQSIGTKRTNSENGNEAKRGRYEEENSGDNSYVSAEYDYITSKDFIGAFPIKGRPPCLLAWKNRPGRIWPNQKIVEKIFDSEIFIVAKPAIVNQCAEKDFCLGFNLAEMLLASDECMSRGQKLCVLILKAFQKGVLNKYKEILTSFHWKTAFYLTCETMEPCMFEQETLLVALSTVLQYMIDCLGKLHLRHYFIDSNLFAHFEHEKAQAMIEEIRKIAEDPLKALEFFFQKEDEERRVTIELPKLDAMELQRREKDPSSKHQAMTFASLMTQIQDGTKDDHSKISEALFDTLKLIIEDELGGKGENLIKKDTDISSLNALITQGVQYANKEFSSREEKKQELENLRRTAISAGLNMLFGKK